MDRRAEVYEIASAIPVGKVFSYRDVGRLCVPPVSARRVGSFMSQLADAGPHLVAWWRVTGSDGGLPIAKRDPRLCIVQRERLESEGVAFDVQGRVRDFACWATEEEMLSRIDLN